LTPPWDWRFGNADLIGGAISRRLLTLWDSLDVESEFGFVKRFGDMHTDEAWLVLNFRWTRFPWNQYLRTSIAITSGPSFAVDLPRNAHHNAAILNYFSPQITFALPQDPQYELMVQMHHRSDIANIGRGGPRSWLAVSDVRTATASEPGKPARKTPTVSSARFATSASVPALLIAMPEGCLPASTVAIWTGGEVVGSMT
jgi:hypothetical protein